MIAYYDYSDYEGRHIGCYVSDDTLEETMRDLHLFRIIDGKDVYNRISMSQAPDGWKKEPRYDWLEKANNYITTMFVMLWIVFLFFFVGIPLDNGEMFGGWFWKAALEFSMLTGIGQ